MKYKTMKFASILVASIALLGIAAFGENEGKAQFGDIPTDHYVVTQEVDSVFTSWTNGQDIAFNNSSPDKFKIGDQTLVQILDGKLDATNGVAFGELYVLPEEVPGGHVGDGHAILNNESLRFTNTTSGPDITYGLNGISALYPGGNEQWYKFDNSTNGIARLKDLDAYVRLDELQEGISFNTLSATNLTINGKQVALEGHTHTTNDIEGLDAVLSEYVKLADLQEGITFDTMNVTNLTVDGKQVLTGEDDPAFKEVFTNSTLNLISYDGINLVGTNSVKITSQQLDIKGDVAINGDVYVKGVGGYEGAETEGKVDLATAINEALNAGTTIGEIQDAAAEAQQEIEDANDIEGIKSALIRFFDAIK